MIAGMETGLFQVVAHPDQIFRRMKKWNAEMDAISKEIKECAASTGVLLEKTSVICWKGRNAYIEKNFGKNFQISYRLFMELMHTR